MKKLKVILDVLGAVMLINQEKISRKNAMINFIKLLINYFSITAIHLMLK